MKNDAFAQMEQADDVPGNLTFENWEKSMEKYPTFKYWNIVLKYELLILVFVSLHGQGRLIVFIHFVYM